MKKFIKLAIAVCVSGILTGCDSLKSTYDCDDKAVLEIVKEEIKNSRSYRDVREVIISEIIQRDGKLTKGLKVCQAKVTYSWKEEEKIRWIHPCSYVYTTEKGKKNGKSGVVVRFYETCGWPPRRNLQE